MRMVAPPAAFKDWHCYNLSQNLVQDWWLLYFAWRVPKIDPIKGDRG